MRYGWSTGKSNSGTSSFLGKISSSRVDPSRLAYFDDAVARFSHGNQSLRTRLARRQVEVGEFRNGVSDKIVDRPAEIATRHVHDGNI